MKEFFSPKGLAEHLGVDLGTVYNWNYQKIGPPFIKVNGSVRYRRADVEAWLTAKERGTDRRAS